MARHNNTKSPSRRSWTSILLVAFTAGMVVTGLLSFALPYTVVISGLHNWFAVAFLLLFIFHITNNSKTLASYLKKPTGRKQGVVAVVISVGLIAGVVFYVPPFSSLIEFSHQLKKSKVLRRAVIKPSLLASIRVVLLSSLSCVPVRIMNHHRSRFFGA